MIDFSNVKNIVIPEGEVFSVARGEEILWQKSRLPFEYQEVGYIESTGTQYINTEVYAPDGFTAEIGIKVVEDAKEYGIIGFWGGDNKRYFAKYSSWYFGSNGLYSLASGLPYNKYAKLELSTISTNKFLKINGQEKPIGSAVLVDSENPTANIPVYLLMVNGHVAKAVAELYYCKIWDLHNTLVRDYVPCYRKSDGEIGAFDLLSNKFFTNAGTGEFLYG